MTAEHQFNIVLRFDVADAVETMVRSGAYASVNDAVQDGLRALLQRRADVEEFLRTEVVAGHAEYLADPSKAVPAAELLERIRLCRSERDALWRSCG